MTLTVEVRRHLKRDPHDVSVGVFRTLVPDTSKEGQRRPFQPSPLRRTTSITTNSRCHCHLTGHLRHHHLCRHLPSSITGIQPHVKAATLFTHWTHWLRTDSRLGIVLGSGHGDQQHR